MARPRKRARPIEQDLSEDRLVAAVRTLVAASACWLARPEKPENRLPSDDAQADVLAAVVRSLEDFAQLQQAAAALHLGVELREGFVEAYSLLAKRPKSARKAVVAPGPHLDYDYTVTHTPDGKRVPNPDPEDLARARIQRAYGEYTLYAKGRVECLSEGDLDHLLSAAIREATDAGPQGPVDAANRAVAYLQRRISVLPDPVAADGVADSRDRGTGRSIGIAAANRRWPPQPDQVCGGQPTGCDLGYFFGARWPVEKAIDSFSRRAVGPLLSALGSQLERIDNARAWLELLLGPGAHHAPALKEKVLVSEDGINITGEREIERVIAMPVVQRIRVLALGRAFDDNSPRRITTGQ